MPIGVGEPRPKQESAVPRLTLVDGVAKEEAGVRGCPMMMTSIRLHLQHDLLVPVEDLGVDGATDVEDDVGVA